MNIVDLIIIAIILGAAQRGLHIGLSRLILSAMGFLFGLFAGSWLAHYFTPATVSSTDQALIAIASSFICAGMFAGLGERASIYLTEHVHKYKLAYVNRIFGGAFEVVFAVFTVWLLASVFSNTQTYNIGANVRHSAIIQGLNANLPAPPDLLAGLERAIGTDGLPKVFVGNEPSAKTIRNNATIDTEATRAAQKSVVRVEGIGCGGVLEGSGFVAAPTLVMTNAHVIAGLSKPIVIVGNKTFNATPVYFDPNLDIAILKTATLPAPALPFNVRTLPSETPILVMGYPGGGAFTISGGAIINDITAVGRNIYDRGLVTRDIYQVQADVEPGNSGGPMIDKDGQVAGLVFAKAVSEQNVGYTLLAKQLTEPLQKAQSADTKVSTGRCAG